MLRRLRSQETTRGISLSPRLRLLRFLRQCRAICRAMTRGTSPNRFRSRLPAMTRGINRRQFHNRLRRPPHGDPWNQPQPAQPTPNADPWNSQPQPQPKPQPQVAAEDDEYSMSDQSLGEATAMNLDDLKKLFEVKKVEQFAADDPKNPKNIQPAKKHSDE